MAEGAELEVTCDWKQTHNQIKGDRSKLDGNGSTEASEARWHGGRHFAAFVFGVGVSVAAPRAVM